MTPTQLNQTIYDWAGDKKFLLLERALYWRPNAHGYTHNISEAGRYSREEAERFCNGSGGEVTFEPEPVPNYAGDLNVVHELVMKQSISWIHRVNNAMKPNSVQLMLPRGFQLIDASSLQRAEAIVKVIQSK